MSLLLFTRLEVYLGYFKIDLDSSCDGTHCHSSMTNNLGNSFVILSLKNEKGWKNALCFCKACVVFSAFHYCWDYLCKPKLTKKK